MYNLFKMECYQLSHNSIFYLMMGLSALFGAVMGPGFLVGNISVINCTELNVVSHMLVATFVYSLILLVPGIILLVRQLKSPDTSSAIAAGYSRFQVFMVKALMFLGVMFFASVLHAFAGEVMSDIYIILMGGHVLGFNVVFKIILLDMPRILFLTLFVTAAAYSMIVLFAVFFMDAAKTIVAATVAGLVEFITAAPLFFKGSEPWYLPMFMEKKVVSPWMSLSSGKIIFLLCLGYTVLFLGSGYLIFRRKALK
ncbi:MAG: hypothetical protein RR614_03800 [Eubacterium sp.]